MAERIEEGSKRYILLNKGLEKSNHVSFLVVFKRFVLQL